LPVPSAPPPPPQAANTPDNTKHRVLARGAARVADIERSDYGFKGSASTVHKLERCCSSRASAITTGAAFSLATIKA
jgi:hypothetical protein